MEGNIEKLFERVLEENISDESRERVKELSENLRSATIPRELEEEVENVDEASNENLYQKIMGLEIPEKIKLALKGNQTARAILIRDSNKQVPLFVLENPRITDHEVQEFSKSRDVSDLVLRAISQNGNWTKSYQLKFSLVSNPKTPIDVSLKWLKFIQKKDLRNLARSKNVPQVIANQARKLMGRT